MYIFVNVHGINAQLVSISAICPNFPLQCTATQKEFEVHMPKVGMEGVTELLDFGENG